MKLVPTNDITSMVVCRAVGGIVSWAMLCLSVVFGLMLSTKTMKGTVNRPWLLGAHRGFSGFAVIFVFVHVLALLFDSYTHFDLIDILLPFSSSWHPLAVAWGVVAMWVVLAVELTSLVRKHIPNRIWKRTHYASFLLFVFATVHGLTAGTDTKTMYAIVLTLFVAIPISVLVGIRINKWIDSDAVPVDRLVRVKTGNRS